MSTIGNRKAFTLVEVLLAVSILALGVVGVLRGYASAIDALEVGQENIDAVHLLSKKMVEIEQQALEEEGICTGISSGEFTGRYKGFKWETTVDSSVDEELNEVEITVFNSKATPIRKFKLVNYVKNKDQI